MTPRLHKILEREAIREQLGYAMLNRDYIVATNAHALVEHSTETFFGRHNRKEIPKGKQFKVPRKLCEMMSYGTSHALFIAPNIISIAYQGALMQFALEETKDYKDYRQILGKPNKEDKGEIGLQPELLNNLRQAIDPKANIVYLTFQKGHTPIVVKTQGGEIENYRALLMPCAIMDDLMV
jgi:hypothetical protein